MSGWVGKFRELEQPSHPEIPSWSQSFQQHPVLPFYSLRTSVSRGYTWSGWMFKGDGATHMQSSLGQYLPYQIRRMSSLVVAWDGNVHIVQNKVSVTENNGRQINTTHLCERLPVSPKINNYKLQLPKGCLDLVGEGSGSGVASNRSDSTGIANFSASHQPVFLEDTALISAAFSMGQASRRIIQVLFRLWYRCYLFSFVDVLFHLEVKSGAI